MSTDRNPIEVTQRRWDADTGWDVSTEVPSMRATMSATRILGDQQAALHVNMWPYSTLTGVTTLVHKLHREFGPAMSVSMTGRADHQNHETEVTVVLSVDDVRLLAVKLAEAVAEYDAAEVA